MVKVIKLRSKSDPTTMAKMSQNVLAAHDDNVLDLEMSNQSLATTVAVARMRPWAASMSKRRCVLRRGRMQKT